MFKQKVQQLLENALQERPDLFLIDFDITSDNSIKVIIDGDKGVLVEDCMFISRAIEHNLDREEIDFSLEVASAGATTPLTLPRQYKRHLGRELDVLLRDGKKLSGEISAAESDSILLTWKSKEPKAVGKGKTMVIKEAKISILDIKEAKVKIKF